MFGFRLKETFVQVTIESMKNGGRPLGLSASKQCTESSPIIMNADDPVVVLSSSDEEINPPSKLHHCLSEPIEKSANGQKPKEEEGKHRPKCRGDQSRKHKSHRSKPIVLLSEGEFGSISSEGECLDVVSISSTNSDPVKKRPESNLQPDDRQNPLKLLQRGFRAGLSKFQMKIM